MTTKTTTKEVITERIDKWTYEDWATKSSEELAEEIWQDICKWAATTIPNR